MALEECNPASSDADISPRKAYEAPALVELDVEDTEASAGGANDGITFS
jgi:hypothetical protein